MQPLTENNPDIYSNIEEVNHGAPKAKPRSAPTSQPPNLPKGQPPQAKPRTDNPKKAGNTNAAPYVHVCTTTFICGIVLYLSISITLLTA